MRSRLSATIRLGVPLALLSAVALVLEAGLRWR
jgi:hypothetical protein